MCSLILFYYNAKRIFCTSPSCSVYIWNPTTVLNERMCLWGSNVLCPILHIFMRSRQCKKRFFYSGHVFTFFNVFLFCQSFFFLFLKTFIENIIEISFETTETNWVCMIVFLCAYDRISISTYILTSIVIYLPYRLTSSDVIRRCVFVYVGKLV